MTNDLLSQLTIQDIREIRDIIRCIDDECVLFDLEKKDYSEYINSDEFFKDVLNRMKDNNHYKPPCRERYPVLLEQAEYVTSYTQNPNSRTTENVFIRSIVAHQLHEEGYTYSEIGRVIKKSHATVMFYVNKVNDMLSLPQMYTTEITQYEQFKEIADTI